jgi:hypothetical protein
VLPLNELSLALLHCLNNINSQLIAHDIIGRNNDNVLKLLYFPSVITTVQKETGLSPVDHLHCFKQELLRPFSALLSQQ